MFRWLTAMVWSTGEITIRGRLVYVDGDGMALDTGEAGARMAFAFPSASDLEPPAHDLARARAKRDQRARKEQADLRRAALDEEYLFDPTASQEHVVLDQLRRSRRLGKMFDRLADE
ncbi:MAG: hypothetical protein P8N02_05455 [Actinomycetota bacterium]|nr:hypothetical protein [Actinomycetota bacterium]